MKDDEFCKEDLKLVKSFLRKNGEKLIFLKKVIWTYESRFLSRERRFRTKFECQVWYGIIDESFANIDFTIFIWKLNYFLDDHLIEPG